MCLAFTVVNVLVYVMVTDGDNDNDNDSRGVVDKTDRNYENRLREKHFKYSEF